MKRLLMLAALAAVGTVGCKGNDHGQHVQNDTPMMGTNGKAATNGQIVQTQYRPSGAGVQQAGGTNAANSGIVVPAVGTATVNCPNGMCPNTLPPVR